jgi:hypothetical protein
LHLTRAFTNEPLVAPLTSVATRGGQLILLPPISLLLAHSDQFSIEFEKFPNFPNSIGAINGKNIRFVKQTNTI